MAVQITWIHHASFRLANGSVIYIDPWKIPSAPHDGNIVFVSHTHYDHLSDVDARKVLAKGGTFVGPAEVIGKLGAGTALAAGQTIELGPVKLTGTPAYNSAKNFHPQAKGWLGVIVELDGKRIYYAGDSDRIGEMDALSDIDLALLPVGGTYTMDAAEAADAVRAFTPKAAMPYHYGDIVGTADDAQRFASLCPVPVQMLQPGQTITL